MAWRAKTAAPHRDDLHEAPSCLQGNYFSCQRCVDSVRRMLLRWRGAVMAFSSELLIQSSHRSHLTHSPLPPPPSPTLVPALGLGAKTGRLHVKTEKNLEAQGNSGPQLWDREVNRCLLHACVRACKGVCVLITTSAEEVQGTVPQNSEWALVRSLPQ